MKRGLQVGLLVVAWAFALPTLAETLRGVVIAVIDGDTVLFKSERQGAQSHVFLKVRLADIDAPEKDQVYGDTATRTLKALVLNQPVEINTVATDIYGRKIAHLQLGALQVNTEMLRLGLAWSSSRYRRNAEALAAQNEARRALRGLWIDAAPTPPWVWRRAQKASVNY